MNNNTSQQNITDYLRELLNTKMNANQINLEFKAITDILQYLHLLAQFKKLKKLSLHGNRLKQLPTDLSSLQNLQYLDISNNLLEDNVQMTILSLKSLPNLKNLIFPVRKQKQQKIVQEIKTLEYFNNIKVIRQQAKKQFVFNLVNKQSMQQYQQKLCEMYKTLLNCQQKYLDQIPQDDAIQKFMQQIHSISKQSLQKLSRTKDQASHSLQVVILYTTRQQMLEHIKIRALNLCMDIYSDLGLFIKNISDQQDELFKNLTEQSLSLARLQYQVKEQEQQQRKNSQGKGQYVLLNKNMTMQKQIKRLRKQKEDMLAQMSQVQNQNRRLLDTLTRYGKGDRSVLSNFQLSKDHKFDSIQNNNSHKTIPLPTLRSNQKNYNLKTQSGGAHNLTQNYSTGGNRNLTLKQLKDTIEEIYESKLKFDQKNFDGKIARQTMHQYLFTYLNQKYGLKNLTIEAAGSIVSGIQAYSIQDNDVCIFGKILRNQVDQQFRFVQTQLKTTVADLLKMHVKTKMPYKSATQINQMVQEKVNNEIGYQEAEDIVKYLYNKQDSALILKKLDLLFKMNSKKRDQVSHSRRLTRQDQLTLQNQKQTRKIKFTIFMKCVLDFQLKNHQKLLKPLVRIFKVRDSDSDGIINEQEFISIIQQLCGQSNADIVPYLLNIIDPYETKSITFTQMVRLVANYPQNSPILSRFIGRNDEYQEQDDFKQ